MNTQPEDNTQPEAIKLAEWLETSPNTRDKKGAAELRRLHEENQTLIEKAQAYQDIHDAVVNDNDSLYALNRELVEALEDMNNGLKYIRETHGDLYGVGWDRAQDKAEAALLKAQGEKE